MFDRPTRLLSGVAAVVALLWVVMTGTVQWQELCVGFVAVTLTTVFFASVLRSEALNFEVTLRDLLQIRYVPMAIVKDCWLVTAVLFRDLAGQPAGSLYRVCGFKTSRRDPLLIGRSALAITYSSMSPNMIALGVDPAQSLMIFHQIKRDQPSAMLHSLGATPHPDDEAR